MMLRIGLAAVHRMFRAQNVLQQAESTIKSYHIAGRCLAKIGNIRSLQTLTQNVQPQITIPNQPSLILARLNAVSIINLPPVRTLTKFSINKGKRKTVKAVVKRFKRLHWGVWIRTRCGRHKKMWRKSVALKKRLRQHVFVNGQQSTLLDKMVTSFWRRPKYYIDDPYTPYHTRNEFKLTKRKPL